MVTATFLIRVQTLAENYGCPCGCLAKALDHTNAHNRRLSSFPMASILTSSGSSNRSLVTCGSSNHTLNNLRLFDLPKWIPVGNWAARRSAVTSTCCGLAVSFKVRNEATLCTTANTSSVYYRLRYDGPTFLSRPMGGDIIIFSNGATFSCHPPI